MNENRIKKENGITLIAVIITVIALIILARRDNINASRRKWAII